MDNESIINQKDKIDREIYGLLHENIPEKLADEIYSKIGEFETIIKNDYRGEIKLLKGKLTDLKESLTNIEIRLDYEEEQNKLLKNMLKHMCVFRAALNKVVHEYWDIYSSVICNLDYEFLMKKHNLKRKIDNNGVKYAMARINNDCQGLSIDLCHVYLDLNDSFHPKLKPISVIEDSVDKLKELSVNNCIPNYYLSMGINEKILSEFEYIIKNNNSLFI